MINNTNKKKEVLPAFAKLDRRTTMAFPKTVWHSCFGIFFLKIAESVLECKPILSVCTAGKTYLPIR
jgi:hypothetical protein